MDTNLDIKLKGEELKNFILENLLIYLTDHKTIGYIALDNKDRLQNPGKVVIEFKFRPGTSLVTYQIRMVEYAKAANPLKLTVHRENDTTDCDTLSYDKTEKDI